MVTSCSGQCLVKLRSPLAEISPPVATSSLCIFLTSLFTRVTDAANGVRSRFSAFFQKQTMAYKEANPLMFVRIIRCQRRV